MQKDLIYKGSTKSLYHHEKEHMLKMSFEDTLKTSAKDLIEIPGKGIINNSISSYIMQQLDLIGVATHFVKKENMRQQTIQHTDIYPIQIHIATVASGRYVTDFGMEPGLIFETPLIDFRVKNKKIGYPPVNESQIMHFGWLYKEEIEDLKTRAMRVHDFLYGLFAGVQIRMIDVKLEFGRVYDEENFMIMLADEISPDTCRLWDMNSNEKLSYEIAEEDPEKILPAYQEVLRRLEG
ncbi:MAG: phosphoribosylaminoimidazolesuccinocarboxamide synthase [Rickettsiales bacterium]|nr:MAG: phosphoribosylaminoimidazolesuccinocarboxamide synthase [Rickettsiales bacterium]